MNVNFKLVPQAVASANLKTRQEVLERIAALAADVYDLDQGEVLDGLEIREKLGSTGFGRGVAIPHTRSDAINRPVVVLLRLETPVDFDAADAMPVDLVFGLISPEHAGATHLHALAAISRMVRDDATHQLMIDTSDPEALYALLSNSFERDAA